MNCFIILTFVSIVCSLSEYNMRKLVRKYSPVIYFHEFEQYFPCSIEHLLENSELYDRSTNLKIKHSLDQFDLKNYSSSNYYIKISESQFNGAEYSLNSTPIYYSVEYFENHININYMTLYAYQGGQTLRAYITNEPMFLFKKYDFIIETLGIHQGDLERVVVKLKQIASDKQLNITDRFKVIEVGFERHGDLKYYSVDKVYWKGSHPIVNVALNGHSSHNPFTSSDFVVEANYQVVEIGSFLGQSKLWQPKIFKQLGIDPSGEPFGDQVWALFQGRLGIKQQNEFKLATYLNGKKLNFFHWTQAKLIDKIAKKIYPKKILEGNGPIGPGGRSWVTKNQIDNFYS